MKALVLVAAVVALAGIACGGNSKGSSAAGPSPTTCGPPVLRNSQELRLSEQPRVELAEREVCIGQMVHVQAENWTPGTSLRVALFLQDEIDQSTVGEIVIARGQMEIGAFEANDKGGGTFQFALAASYLRKNGEKVELSSGQEVGIGVFEGAGAGSHGSLKPLSIR